MVGRGPVQVDNLLARADLRQALTAGENERFESVIVRYASLFDAFASTEKTLHANPGDHRTIRWVGLDNEFLPRQLNRRTRKSSTAVSDRD
jgi:hypothetical protein